jgi:AcrR family transcriptional regulator
VSQKSVSSKAVSRNTTRPGTAVETERRRGRPPRLPHESEQVRERILDAAQGLFAEHGVDAVSVEEIGEAAGLSRASVYRYAGGRDEIVLGVTLRRYREWIDGLLAHIERFDTAGEKLVEAVVWTVRVVGREPALSALVTSGAAPTAARTASGVLGARDEIALFIPRIAAVLDPAQLRPGLAPEAVGRHLLEVILDRLERAVRPDDRLRDWLRAWLLPAVLADPPPVPDFVSLTS